ncbi:D-aminoacyl-tRNA deacylase [Aestuariimicrobium sp. T2.26MG-19.2B]|uniref:D-aminoacyl-tRNA deacylase n=1 Tax=Aestuariimicrobium sp. T2.26MG-19.2B TaxID=3040679 RepID=UPI002477ACA8|nr:D-aminoacyl-tRNA deacylase [Aestuariimicrobium sp. T2.26MG-19.2B]CAI9405379.1 D-aminoacyl-tRNA deacylase [Aestuariimicrobium sp. T2.26MG-19.2B]
MRVVLQRATRAQVTVDGEVVGRLSSPGLVALVGITHADTRETAVRMAAKTWGLRILEAPPGGDTAHAECSASDLDAPILVISQFTLYADVRKGRRPSWSAAAPGPVSEPLVEAYVQALTDLGARVETGRFGAQMQVELVNDGPVTIILDSDSWG